MLETNDDTQLVFTVSLSGALAEPATVRFATADDTATVADEDYVAISGTLTFAPGETTALVTVNVNGDTKSELDEVFKLVLSDPSANTRLVSSTATGTITNDDGLSVTGSSVLETNDDTQLIFTVSLSEAAAETTTVVYGTTDGTATIADDDYVAASGTLTFAPGQTTALVTVTIKGDTSAELDEAFNLVLSSPSANVRLVGSTAAGTIINDDEAEPLAFADGAFGDDEDWLTFFE